MRNALTVTCACQIVSRRQSKAEPSTMCTVGAIQKVGSESSQSLTFYNHREGPYEGLLLVKSATRRLHHDCKSFVSRQRCPMITPRWTTLVATLRCVGPSRGAECSGRQPRHSCPPRPRNTPVEVGPRQPEHPCSLTIPAPSTHAMVDIMDMVLNRYIRVRCSLLPYFWKSHIAQ